MVYLKTCAKNHTIAMTWAGNNIIDIAVIFRRPFKIAHRRLADSELTDIKKFAYEFLHLSKTARDMLL